MRRLLLLLLPVAIILPAAGCSNERSGPLGSEPVPNNPSPSGTDMTIDFSEFAGGDTVTSTHGIEVSLTARGERCADAVIAFDTSVPHGDEGDDLDLGSPNQAFGGPGVGAGGAGGPFVNDRPVGNLLVIQEDPAYPDGNPDLQDDCSAGGTIVLDFGALSAAGVTLSTITVMDVDNSKQGRSEFRFYGEGDEVLSVVNPPVTGRNGVAIIDLGPVSGVLRMEVVQTVSVAIARIAITVPDPPGETTG